ncbi:MAG: AtpZ/AtpI family protein [Pyrinomonadaceae bacterium]
MANRDEEETTRKGALLYGAIFSLVISVIVCLGIGWVLDRWLGTSPWLLVSGIVLGAVVGFYQFIRLVSRIS